MSIQQALEVLNNIDSEKLYIELIQQVEKDFNRAQIPLTLDLNNSPSELVTEIVRIVEHLFTNNPSLLNQLLYLVDLNENSLSNVSFEKPTLASEQLACLILKREWQKVFIRSLHSSN